MSFFKKNPLLSLGLLALVLVGLPAAVFLSQKQAENRSRASRTVVLSFAPTSTSTSPISVSPNGTVSIDLMLDPGTSQVSFLKAQLTYDATKFRVDSGGFAVNQQAFSQAIQGPIYGSGTISFALSVGADGTKAIQSPTKAGTLTLHALSSSGTSQVGFAAGAQALSIDPNSTPTENVVSSTMPAFLTVGGVTTSVTPTPPPTSCSNSPSDTMLVIDKSGSMSVASDVNKITQAKTAAKSYVDIISQDTRNTIGLVSYENTATVNSPLTTNYSSVKTQIDSLTAIGSTCTECAILAANAEIAKSTSSNKKVVILLTDGLANYIQGGTSQVDTALAEQKALAAAIAGHSAKGTVFYTIGLGNTINGAFLQQIAQQTGGQYFPSPTADQLNSIYNQISQIAGKGSINGFVYNDANGNGTFNTGESKLSGWTLQLFPAGSNTPQTFSSDPNFGFNITGICDGSYTLKEVLKPGFHQTQPTDPNGYQITINNGSAITDKNFGNNQGNTCADGIDNNGNHLIDIADPICHTDGNPNNPATYDPNLPETGNTCSDHLDNNNNGFTDTQDPACHTDGDPENPGTYDPNLPENGNTCADRLDNNGNGLIDAKDPICHTDGNPNNPGSYDPKLPETGGGGTKLNLTVFLHGIGNSGDNATTLNSLSNKNPVHKTINADVSIYNITNQLISSTSGQITYASASGDFRGTVVTSNPLAAGNYNIRVRTAQHLTRLIPGIQAIVNTGINQLPPAVLVAGDVNQDNKLNILDYNLLIGCSDTVPDPLCTGIMKIQTDLDDNGAIDIHDYNLFLRELSTQLGE
ncbi:MAG TPA: VWA domain-containing protein [Candidatus Saccharimonadales bacterium]|nr:VWA domain-containing protein [Candidatus Saccharimonadales bacterium]